MPVFTPPTRELSYGAQKSSHLLPRLISGLLLCLMLSLVLGCVGPARGGTAQATPDTLKAILKDTAPGDTITLAPGQYGTLWLTRTFGEGNTPVTLKSMDPAKPARFTALKAEGGQGVVLDGLVFDYSYAPGDDPQQLRVSQITKSQDIAIRNSLFEGDVVRGTGTSADGYGSGFGLAVRWSSGVRIENSTFRGWYRGLIVSQSRDITLRGSDFSDMRSDGVNFAEVVQVLIEENSFHDFRRHPRSGDHPDMIQFWTNGIATPNRNITIRNNILNAGTGPWTQSIFMRNEKVDVQGGGPEMFYQNVTITGNVIINAHLHGITLGETNGAVIADNTLVRHPTATLTNGNLEVMTPTIRVASKSKNVVIARNVVADIAGANKQASWRFLGNLKIQDRSPEGSGFYDDVFVAARHGDPVLLSSFRYLPDGPAGQAQVGAPALRFIAQSEQGAAATPLIQVARDARFLNRFTFDARLSPDAQDLLWHFEGADGAQVGKPAKGISVTQTFPGPGQYWATARLGTGPDAPQARVRLEVPDPRVLRLGNKGLLIQRAGESRALEKIPLHHLEDGTVVLRLGEGQDLLQLHQNTISRFFGAADMALDLRLRAGDTKNPTGEILRIHNNLIVTMTAQGQINLWLNTAETAKPVMVFTPPLRLFDGAWHDIAIRYDAHEGLVKLSVDGVERARARAKGRLRPHESWGMAFGNPFGQKKTFDGEIAHLDLRVDAARFASY